MRTFYFTFGQSHKKKDGTPMKDTYVKVTADNYVSARHKFIEEFSSKEMPSPTSWAFQYTEEEWNNDISQYYNPVGEVVL